MSLEYDARVYQGDITNFILENERGLVASGMGTGKTVSTATAISTVLMLEQGCVLIVAPLRVARSTWPDEFQKWNHLKGINIVPIVGDVDERKLAIRTPSRVYTTNYENLPWLLEYWGNKWPYTMVVLDESTKVKGFRTRQGSKRAKALAKVAHTKIKRMVLLSGTPTPNGIKDIWAQLWFIDRGERLGKSFTAFSERWFRTDKSGYGIKPMPYAQREIQDLMRDVCIAVEAKDYFDIKEPIVNNVYIDLPFRARQLYDDMEKKMFMELECGSEVEAFNAAARTIKCLQIANGFAFTDDKGAHRELHDAKLDALESIVEEACGMPVLVAYHFKPDLARLKKRFPEGRELDKDPQTIKDWNSGEIPILFIHPASAGHGLNLQDGGNIMVYYAHWWNFEERSQVLERIGPTRQAQAGHDRPVFVHNIIARDTVDELVIERNETKREVQDILMDAMKRRKAKK